MIRVRVMTVVVLQIMDAGAVMRHVLCAKSYSEYTIALSAPQNNPVYEFALGE